MEQTRHLQEEKMFTVWSNHLYLHSPSTKQPMSPFAVWMDANKASKRLEVLWFSIASVGYSCDDESLHWKSFIYLDRLYSSVWVHLVQLNVQGRNKLTVTEERCFFPQGKGLWFKVFIPSRVQFIEEWRRERYEPFFCVKKWQQRLCSIDLTLA